MQDKDLKKGKKSRLETKSSSFFLGGFFPVHERRTRFDSYWLFKEIFDVFGWSNEIFPFSLPFDFLERKKKQIVS